MHFNKKPKDPNSEPSHGRGIFSLSRRVLLQSLCSNFSFNHRKCMLGPGAWATLHVQIKVKGEVLQSLTFRAFVLAAFAVFFGVFIIPKVCSSYSTQLARYGKCLTPLSIKQCNYKIRADEINSSLIKGYSK